MQRHSKFFLDDGEEDKAGNEGFVLATSAHLHKRVNVDGVIVDEFTTSMEIQRIRDNENQEP